MVKGLKQFDALVMSEAIYRHRRKASSLGVKKISRAKHEAAGPARQRWMVFKKVKPLSKSVRDNKRR